MKNQMKNDLWTKFKNLYLTSFQLVLFIIALVLIIICIFFYFQLKDDNYNQLSLIVSVFSSIIAALLCSAIINVYEMRRKDAIDNDEKRELANNFTMIKDASVTYQLMIHAQLMYGEQRSGQMTLLPLVIL